jgi:hypothetical protein
MRDAKGTGVGKILVAGREIQQPAPGQARKVAGSGPSPYEGAQVQNGST